MSGDEPEPEPESEVQREELHDRTEATQLASTSYKVRGQLDDPGGIGVLGRNDAKSDASVGVKGVTYSSDFFAAGVEGKAFASSGTPAGVEGSAYGPTGSGVVGNGYAKSGTAHGVEGYTRSYEGRAVFGSATSGSGQCTGVYGKSTSDEGIGVWGDARSGSGPTFGIIGHSRSPDGIALYARNFDNDGLAVSARGRLAVRRNYSASGASFDRHAATVENTSGDATGDVLGLKTQVTKPGKKMNFVSFQTPNGLAGQIEGDGSGGITIKGDSADFAEYFPKADPDREFDPGEVVGLRDGEVVDTTRGVDAVMVVSTTPLLVGNAPLDDGDDPEDSDENVELALVGQVSVRVSGSVESGDRLVASPEDDGTAVPLGRVDGERAGPPVGTALDGRDGSGTGEVLAIVSPFGASGHSPRRSDAATPGSDAGEVDTGRIAALEAENERLREENEALRERVAAIEARMGDDAVGPASADD